MPSRTNPVAEATSLARWVLLQIGRELRVARVIAGKTQAQVGTAVRRSASYVSRIESGRVRNASMERLMRHAAAVGMKLYANVFPAGRRPLDAAQLGLLEDFNARLHPAWSRQFEVVVPQPGDLRAADELIRIASCSCAVEAITRFADVQAQIRSAHAKQRDLGADRLILVVRGSHANRRMIRAAGPLLNEMLPVGTRTALRALGAGQDPGGDCLILL